jgi:hypothetical protein
MQGNDLSQRRKGAEEATENIRLRRPGLPLSQSRKGSEASRMELESELPSELLAE